MLDLPSFSVESTFSYTYSSSDFLFLAKVRLSLILTVSHLINLRSRLMAPFPFLLAKTAFSFLQTGRFVVLRPLVSFQQAQFVPDFPLKPAQFCKLYTGLGSTNKFVSFLLLYDFLSDSRSVLSTVLFSVFSFTSNSLAHLAGRKKENSLAYLPLNPSKCEASFFSVDPHQANLQPNLLLLGSRLRFNPTPTFLGVTFDHTLSFSKHVPLLKAKFFPRLKALCCISASSWGPSKESLSLLYKSFLRFLLTYASPGWFPFLSATNLTKLERLH